MPKFVSHSPTQTKNLAKQMARQFKGGKILGLMGNLGSGKTQFTKGLAEYFGIENPITSPTFVLLKPYQIKKDRSRSVPTAIKQLIHIDCYRVKDPTELLAIGLNEYLQDSKNLIVIEWAEKIKSILPKDTCWIKFELGKKENERIIKKEL